MRNEIALGEYSDVAFANYKVICEIVEAQNNYVSAVREWRKSVNLGKPNIDIARWRVRSASDLICMGIEPNYSDIVKRLRTPLPHINHI